jgi:hypothetical protein
MSAQEALAARNASVVELKRLLGVNTELAEQKLTERRPNRREWPNATRHPKYVQ